MSASIVPASRSSSAGSGARRAYPMPRTIDSRRSSTTCHMGRSPMSSTASPCCRTEPRLRRDSRPNIASDTQVMGSSMTSPLLFTSFSLRGVETRNRIVISPMCQYSAEDGIADDWHFVHLGKFAQGGAGIVFVEATAVEARGRITHGDLGIWSDAHVPPLRRIADFVKAQGAVPAIQLAHAGRKASMARPWFGNGPLAQADFDRGEKAWS